MRPSTNTFRSRPAIMLIGSRALGLTAPCVLTCVLAALPASLALTDPAPPADEQIVLQADSQEAVALARAGNIDQALAQLAALRAARPDDTGLLHDQTVVLAWADRDNDVLANASKIDRDEAPLYVLSPVAKSARNLREYAEAEHWYRAILARDADNLDARLGLAMTYADSGDTARGLTLIDTLAPAQRRRPAALMTEAYLYESEHRLVEALTAYERVLEQQATNRDALRGKALVFRSLLLPDKALEIAAEHPGILSAAEIEGLEADEVALAVRYGSQTPYPAANRYRGTDAAIAALDRFLATRADDPQIERRLKYDRVVALADRMRMDEAVAQYEALEAEPDSVPIYVLASVAKAYLYERQPETALSLLRSAVARAPDDIELQLSLFYAYAAMEDHASAMAVADNLVERLPVTNQTPGSRVSKANPAYMRAEIAAGLARAYADQLAESQAHFESLLADAPHNTDVRHELAGVYRWRGWADRSLFEYEQVLAVEPDLLGARIGRTHAQLDRREWVRAEDEIKSLVAVHGDDAAVLRLDERWSLHNSSELRITGSTGESSGQTFGSEQYQVDGYWFTRPLAYRYRAFVHSHDSSAEFSDGDGSRHRIGAGAEYRYERWAWTAELSGSRTGATQTGLRLTGERRLGDFWSVGAVLDFNSNETPLQGHRVGVESDVAAVTARYAAHESAAANFRLTRQDFSDGNVRTAFTADARRRLYTAPAFKLEATGELSTSHNSRDDVAYFNPERDLGVLAGLAGTWRQFRRYEQSFTHGLHARAGVYDQDGFGSDAVWLADYQFRAQLNNAVSLNAGIRRSRMVYDGEAEYATFFLGGVEVRF